MANKIDFRDLVHRQRQYFLSDETKDLQFRKKQLSMLRDLIVEHEYEIYEALYTDFKKPHFETYLSENGYMIMEIDHFLKKLKKCSLNGIIRPHKTSENTFQSFEFSLF